MIMICESGIPAEAIVDAPPIWRECVLDGWLEKQVWSNVANLLRVRYEPSWYLKSGRVWIMWVVV